MSRAAAIAVLLALALSAGLSACGEKEKAAAPPPREITGDEIAYFCRMAVTEHAGPKGQIFLTGRDEPYWFASARDAIAFTMLPGEPKNIAAIYVTDLARAKNWEQPEPGTWVEAREAMFVIESARTGGMGVAEAVPFSSEETARDFVAEYGGRMLPFADLPQSYILGPGGGAPGAEMMQPGMNGGPPMDQPPASTEPHDQP